MSMRGGVCDGKMHRSEQDKAHLQPWRKEGAEMNETFGQRLKRIRKERKYTQRKLAKKSGIYHQNISNYELERAYPNLMTIEWLCMALDVTATELLGF